VDGTWTIERSSTVFAGYRVNETFVAGNLKKTASGRTPEVMGSLTVEGSRITAAEVTADLTQLESDESRRDNAIRSRGLQTETYPMATFTVTEPIELPSAPVEGEEITVTATGELTLHGTTKPVDVPLKARWDGSTISVATVGDGVPVLFADYGIEPIDIANFVATEDRGTFELQLLFVPE
jgi:polyisoprenoid-binding protein YceI